VSHILVWWLVCNECNILWFDILFWVFCVQNFCWPSIIRISTCLN
jgi:hypothetical protein